MKKFLSIVLTIVLLSFVAATPVLATETTEEVVATYEDGSYLVMKTTEVTSTSTRASTISKSASRSLSLYNSSDEEQWRYTLHATFLYREGISAQCQNRRDEYHIYNSDWSMVSHSTSIDDDSAFGTVTMKCTVLFITISTITKDVSITCDAYGNITYNP